MARGLRLYHGSRRLLKLRVRVLAFARIREIVGAGQQDLEVSTTCSAGELWRSLNERWPALGELETSTRIARNGRIVGAEEELREGDEVALLPPVGGG